MTPAVRPRMLLLAIATVVALLPARLASAQPVPAADEPPQPRIACVALVLPSVHGAEGSATDLATSLRELFESYLTGPSIRAVPLEARLPSQALEEARQKECGHIVTATLTRKRSGGGGSRVGRAVGQAAGTAAWYVPGGPAARISTIAGAQVISSMAQETRAKDELTLEYTVSTPDQARQARPRTEKAKARMDREDLLTPLVEKAAEAIAAVVTAK
jgi:hypothetical protein